MKNTVLLDQYSLSELGSDRGLGRYATMLAAGVMDLHDYRAERLVRSPSKLNAPDQLHIQRDIKRMRLDKRVPYHSTSAHHLPLIKDRPWICSIQDVIPLDLRSYNRLGIKSRLLFKNAERSDLILANSTYTKKRVISKLGISPDRVKTCSLPIGPAFTKTPSAESVSRVKAILEHHKVDAGKPFVVALADLRTPDPRKRYHWIDDVAEGLFANGVPTVVTGRGLLVEKFQRSTVINSLPDEDLSALYSMAVATYYPSAYEGQGLPPQEAMASGCPVVAYRNTSVQEVVGSSHFLLEDPLPWELQTLLEPLPDSSRNEVVERILSWVEAPARLEEARSIATQMAAKYTREIFLESLGNVYKSYFEGRQP